MENPSERIEAIQQAKKTDPDINLYILLNQVDDLIINAVELELKHLKVTQPQVRVLTMLSREGRPVTLDELAKWTFKEFNSVSTLINRMEKKGLIRKEKREGDLKTYVALTEKGSTLYHEHITERSIHLIFNALTAQEKEHLEAILDKLRDVTRGLLGLDYRPPFLP